jgi:hypothetical protein
VSRLRRLALTAHVVSSVGWLGAVLAFLALAVARVYPGLDVVARWVIVPAALASVVTGLISSLTTPWGLVRHYWVLLKLLLVSVATPVLLLKLGPIGALASAATGSDSDAQASMVIHSAGGALVLLAATVLAVVKPRGTTPWQRTGRSKTSSTPDEVPD